MSNESEFDATIEAQEADLNQRNKQARRRNLLILGLAVAAVLFAVVCLFLAMDNRRLAVANAVYGASQAQDKKQLAQEVSDTLCQAPAEKSEAEAQACRNIEAAATEPTPGPEGPQGVQGVAGVPGPPGADGSPGPTGPTGPAGADGSDGSSGTNGTAGADGEPGPQGPPGPMGPAGPAGADGATGADSTVPGPTGPAGADGVDGEQGPAGPQGDEGRGIQSAYCGDDGKWVITYTDGARQDAGSCRTTITPGANP